MRPEVDARPEPPHRFGSILLVRDVGDGGLARREVAGSRTRENARSKKQRQVKELGGERESDHRRRVAGQAEEDDLPSTEAIRHAPENAALPRAASARST